MTGAALAADLAAIGRVRGCTMSLLGQQGPDLVAALRAARVEVLWHPRCPKRQALRRARS
jgi:hypothetical protein